jgi:hypothetical protein
MYEGLALVVSIFSILVAVSAKRDVSAANRAQIPRPSATRHAGSNVTFRFDEEDAKRYGIVCIRAANFAEISRADPLNLNEAAARLYEGARPDKGRWLKYGSGVGRASVRDVADNKRIWKVYCRANADGRIRTTFRISV